MSGAFVPELPSSMGKMDVPVKVAAGFECAISRAVGAKSTELHGAGLTRPAGT